MRDQILILDFGSQVTQLIARRVREAGVSISSNPQISLVAQGRYDAAIDGSPDFVVMFVPADPILDSAMDVQPTLWQDAWEKHQVLIATPGLLLAFLKTVALAWREQARQENAQQIAQLGQDLYESLRTYAGHVDSMGKGLERAVKAYNDGIGSLEGRILPRARRFEDLDAVSGKEIEAPTRVEPVIRPVVAAELTEAEELPPDSPAA